jgi:uncharacterized protein (DUF2164 family)
MTIKLETETQTRFIGSIKRYFKESLDEELGDLKASLLLEFVMREMGPSIYNRAVADAQARAHDILSELDTTCYESDLGYWSKR